MRAGCGVAGESTPGRLGADAIIVAIPQALEVGQIIRPAREANPSIASSRSMCESIDGLARWFQQRGATPAAPGAA